MAESGKLLGPNLIGRLVRNLPWVEAQIGLLQTPVVPAPQIFGGGGKHLVKLQAARLFSDATGGTGTSYTGKPAVVTSPIRTIKKIVASEKITPSGTFAVDSFVWVELIDGRWFVTGAPCD